MQFKQFYNIATKVCSKKSATTFGDLTDCLWQPIEDSYSLIIVLNIMVCVISILLLGLAFEALAVKLPSHYSSKIHRELCTLSNTFIVIIVNVVLSIHYTVL